jgi:hypothetical protein
MMCHDEYPGKKVGMKVNGIYQDLVYADDVNLLAGNMNLLRKFH